MKRTNHVLHAILSVFTGGLWLPVWAFAAWRGGKRRDAFEAGRTAARIEAFERGQSS